MVEVVKVVLPVSLSTLHGIMKHAPVKYLWPLNAAMTHYQIKTAKRVAAFLSQLAVESEELRHTHERWTSRKNFVLAGVNRKAHTATSKEDYFSYWYGNRADLGNTSSDDGNTYRGRGAIQITGKSNYEIIGNGIGYPLKEKPDLIETDINVDMKASAYFFAMLKHLNHVADGVASHNDNSVKLTNLRLTHAVNGGQNALHERLAYYKMALNILGA